MGHSVRLIITAGDTFRLWLGTKPDRGVVAEMQDLIMISASNHKFGRLLGLFAHYDQRSIML
jgi:hypothetical protein